MPLRLGEPLLVIETPTAEGLGSMLGATTIEIKNDPDENVIAAVLQTALDARKIIVATTDVSFYPGQVKLVTELLAKNLSVVIVSVRTPYDIRVLPMVPTVLAAYGGNPPALRAIVDVLMGKAQASGVLPVTLA